MGRDVVERDPLNPAAYVDLGTDAYYLGSLDDALGAFQKALELNPDNPAVHYSLVRVYLAQSRTQKTLIEVQQEMAQGWRLQGLALTQYALNNKSESDKALAELIAASIAIWHFRLRRFVRTGAKPIKHLIGWSEPTVSAMPDLLASRTTHY
jgi:tetratricopeptide (TPR) repeat protein